MAEPPPLAADADPTAAELVAARPHLRYDAMDGLLVEDVPLNAIADTPGPASEITYPKTYPAQ